MNRSFNPKSRAALLAAVFSSLLVATAIARERAAPNAAAVDELITQLGDRAPAVRDAAAADLLKIGRPARSALIAASANSLPQRRAGARELLTRLPIFDSGDPKPLRDMLTRFQVVPEPARAGHALRLLAFDGDTGLEAASRIILESSDEEVLWSMVADMPTADRDRLMASPTFPAVEPTGGPRLYLAGAALFANDRTKAVGYLERCLSELKIATPPARGPLAHLAELLAKDAQEHNDAARELRVRRDAAMLAPTASDDDPMMVARSGVTPPPSDLLRSYLAARVRLHDDEGFADDLASLGVPTEKSIAAVVRAVVTSPALDTPSPSDADNQDEVIRRVPATVWEAIDAIPNDDAVTAMEILDRGGAVAFVDAITRRMLQTPADMSNPPGMINRARVIAPRLAFAKTLEERAAVQEQLRQALFGEKYEVRNNRINDGGLNDSGVWPADVYCGRLLNDIRHAMQRHDDAAVTTLLDRLAPVPIDGSNLAIDVVHVFEVNGRLAESDEVYEEFLDTVLEPLGQMANIPNALNRVAWFCARVGRDLDRAYALAERATALQPQNAALMDTLAEAAFRTGRVKEAVMAESDALRSKPNYDFMIRQLDRFKAGLKPGDETRSMASEDWER